MPDHEITLGEVYRAVIKLDGRLDSLATEMVGRKEYEADQEGIDRRFRESGDTHVRLEKAISTLAERVDSTEKEQRQSRSRWFQSIAIAALGAVLAVIVPLMLRGVL